MSLRHVTNDLLCVLRLRTDPGSWIVPGQLLACAYPRTHAAFAGLKASEIQLLVNLHTRPHSARTLARFELTELHLPTADFQAPSQESLRRGVAEIERTIAEGKRVAVHCGGGRGRTGTMIACALVARGSTPAEALAHVRSLRPGSVETRAQEAAITEFSLGYLSSASLEKTKGANVKSRSEARRQ